MPYVHPLTSFVLDLYSDQCPCLDASALAPLLGGASLMGVDPESGVSGSAAYKVVARDVLEVMRLNGWLIRDHEGWYRLNPAMPAPPPLPSELRPQTDLS